MLAPGAKREGILNAAGEEVLNFRTPPAAFSPENLILAARAIAPSYRANTETKAYAAGRSPASIDGMGGCLARCASQQLNSSRTLNPGLAKGRLLPRM